MKAFISDIHGNYEALQAVFKDIEEHNVNTIICLGDIVGYGPQPVECTDRIMKDADLTILGNHDHALLNEPLGFNRIAAQAIEFTKKIMSCEEADQDPELRDKVSLHCLEHCNSEKPRCFDMENTCAEHWEFLGGLEKSRRDNGLLYVHGSPLDPTFEYMLPDIFPGFDPNRVELMLTEVDRLCFCGHTHFPCAVDSNKTFYYPQRSGNTLTLEHNRKYIINIGSVGQPRDRDIRASYLLLDEDKMTVEWRRISYDIDAVVEKIKNMCGLDNWCGERLRYGK